MFKNRIKNNKHFQQFNKSQNDLINNKYDLIKDDDYHDNEQKSEKPHLPNFKIVENTICHN